MLFGEGIFILNNVERSELLLYLVGLGGSVVKVFFRDFIICGSVFAKGALLVFLILLALYAAQLLEKRNDREYEKKWFNFWFVLKRKFVETVITAVIMGGCVLFFINILQMIDKMLFWKSYEFFVEICTIANICSGKKLYDGLNHCDYLDEIKEGKYNYSSITPKDIFRGMLERYRANYDLEIELLGILKSLTPISILPLVVGYIFEGKNIVFSWNIYTGMLVIILLFYFVKMWKVYRTIKILKIRELEVIERIRDIERITNEMSVQ